MATKKPTKALSSKSVVTAKISSYTCPYCGKSKKETEFYLSSDPLVKTGVTSMCKECAKKIARNYDSSNGTGYGECTRTSVQEALERLDKPFFESIWQSAQADYKARKLASPWESYIITIQTPGYSSLRWKDGDIYSVFRGNAIKDANDADPSVAMEGNKNQEIVIEYQKNRNDVVRLVGYDPFVSESEDDKPLLYSQLIGYLDLSGEGNEDMMRTSSAISIVRGFLQVTKIDNMISDLMSDPIRMSQNIGTIKTLQDAKKNINATITSLAAENCLSLKNSKNASKGDNTWTGKIKKLKDLNLREAEVNGFDIGTCRGMQQVMDLSNASILRQLRLDESEYADMLADQRQMITDLHKERDNYKEISRILLRENLDLKDVLKNNNILDENNLVDLEELFSPFSGLDNQDEAAEGSDNG